MPGKVKVKIISGRNLPVMDRSSDTTDAYVEIKLGSTTYKTDVCRKSLHPQWNSDWYRFEVDDSELQDEPLQIRLMDHDTYSANDAIGKVYLDLNPLLLPAAGTLLKWNDGGTLHENPTNSVMTGWIPVYDTMHGIRGEVNIIVKVELFSDFNKFRQSSCGVQFFCSPVIPHGYFAQIVHGFVEELVVNDDPEYQWIDKIRTPRASNEARQTLFFKLSGELQRKIGLKALDLGGNAVIGYTQSFDLEGESGIVARGIGTAATLVKVVDIPSQNNAECNANEERAQSYLKFLGSAKGFFLNTSSNLKFTKPIPPPTPSPAPSVKSLKLEDLRLKPDTSSKNMTRHLSDREFNAILRPPPTEMIHHSTSLQTLLKQEDMRGTPGNGISQKFRNLRYSSQNMLSKKMFALKAKLSDSAGTEEAENADTADAKKRNAYKYRRTQSDSTGMAEILVRSVFIAASSLDCITETPQLKSQTSEQEDSSEDLKAVDVSYLSLPDTSTRSSNASSSSSDSSSLEDEDTTDIKENIELDTVSHIVETVRKLSMIQPPIADNLVIGLNNGNFKDGEDKLLFVVEDDLESKSDDDYSETLEPDEISNSDVVSLEAESIIEPISHKPKLIIPPVPHRGSFGPGGLLGTAIKTMLMEKANLVGTYTPPTSPESANSTQSEGRSESFFPQFSKTFQKMKRSPTVRSFGEMDTKGFSLGTQFTSLHDIHGACSKVNKYSAHQGKETVLGHLFKRMDKRGLHPGSLQDLPSSSSEEMPSKPESEFEDVETHTPLDSPKEKHGIIDLFKEGKDKILHGPKVLFHRLDSKLHKKDDEEGLLGTALGNVLMDSVNELLAATNVNNSPNTHQTVVVHSNSPNGKSAHSPNGMSAPHSPIASVPGSPTSQPRTPEGFLSKIFHRGSQPSSPDHHKPTTPDSPKPKTFFQRLDSKIHKKDDSHVKQEGLLHTALGNVLMESVNDVLATSSSTGSKPKVGGAPQSSPKEKPPKLSLDLKKVPGGNSSDGSSTATPGEGKSGFFKESKEKLFKAPKMFLKRLDSKIHKKNVGSDKGAVKNEGLLGTALGNVLMESVNDVLATSSCDSKPNSPQPFNHKIANPITSNVSDLTVNTVNPEIDTNSDSINTMHACLTPSLRHSGTPPNEQRSELGHQRTESIGTRISHSPAKLNAIPCILRRSSDSDLSITPKGNSLTGSDRSGGCSSGQFARNAMIRSTVPPENFDIMEYPFLTMSKYPTGFIAFIGGAVSARSVKLLERITNIEEPESRDTWWSEIRMEIRSHARALNCNSVLGYTETTSICDDVCVLSANGTAAIIGYQYSGEINDNVSGLPIIPKTNKEIMTTSLDRNDFEKEKVIKIDSSTTTKSSTTASSPEKDPVMKQACNICHLPYIGNTVPLRNSSSKCCICRAAKVPDVLIATIEMPDGIPSVGRGCFVQSYVCRPLRDLKGESNAKEISDGLPFLEYELHRLLINKLKVKGMNAVFGLKVRISVGERMLIGIATGTAVFLSPLPPPPLPKLVSDRTTDERKLAQLQKSLHDTVKKNKEIYQLRIIEDTTNGKILSDTDDSEDEQGSLDLSAGNKDCCILEVDDPEDVDVLNSLMEPRPPDGFHVVNTELVPGLEELEIVKNLQMFTQIWRAKIQAPYSLDKHFHRLLQSVYFKLRRMIPCALCDLQFRVDSPEPDEIQLCVLGMALGLGDPQKNTKIKRKNLLPKRNDEELIFNLEEDLIPEHGVIQTPPNTNYLHTQTLKHRQKSPIRNRLAARQRHVPYRERHGVDITPLSYVPGGKIEKYLGNLNFFFIRETTSIREEGGLSGFVHSFVTEILAIVRAHVTALGGNAMVAYFITECVLNHNLHKNQGQCLINVGGDVVYVTYYSEDH